LQQVTTAGHSTTDDINIVDTGNVNYKYVRLTGAFNSGSLDLDDYNSMDSGYAKVVLSAGGTGVLAFQPNSNSSRQFLRPTINTNTSIVRNIYIPDSSGTLTQRVAVNGTKYNTAANGVVDLGNVDTATVVKAYVTNAEAVTITKGQVVYIFGASGDRAAVKLAKNTSDTFSSKTLGIVRADIAAGQAGGVTTQGQVSGRNLGAYTAGDI